MTTKDRHDRNGNFLRAGVVAALLAGVSVGAHAFYADLPPPGGWAAPEGAAARATYRAKASEAWANNLLRTTTTLGAGGRTTSVPLAFRLATNAPTYAARAMFGMNPLLLGAGLAAWALSSNLHWDTEQQKWTKPQEGSYPSTGFEYRVIEGPLDSGWLGSAETACNAALLRAMQIDGKGRTATWAESSCTLRYVNPADGPSATISTQKRASATCPVGSWWTPAGCVANVTRVPVTQTEFETKITEKPMPSTVPSELPPGTPLPVENPIINPTPGTDPQVQPWRIPMGDPTRVPDSDPAQYKQPVVRVTPSPTTGNPWRVDMTPEDVISNNPDGIKEPTPIGNDSPEGTPRTETTGLCELYPEILACKKLDVPEETVPRSTSTISFEVENLGLGGGACPAAPQWSDSLGTHAIELGPYCDVISNIVKPLVLAFAALAALMICVQGIREG